MAGIGERRRVLRLAGLVLGLVLVVGTVAACTPAPPEFELRADGGGCEFRIHDGQEAARYPERYRLPNESTALEPRLAEQGCSELGLSESDETTLVEIIDDYDARDAGAFGDVVIRRHARHEYLLFRVRAAAKNAYPCDCVAYENVGRYDDWTAYEEQRDCPHGVSCATRLPGSCLLGLLAVAPFLLLAPVGAVAGDRSNWPPSSRSLAAAGCPAAVGGVVDGVFGAAFFGLVGVSVFGVVRRRQVILAPLSDAATVILLCTAAVVSLLATALAAAFVSVALFAVFVGWLLLLLGYVGYTR